MPTLITEGGDDVVVFRDAELEFAALGLAVLPVGGREKLLAIFDRKSEFEGLSVAFVSDRDLWVFSSIPDNYVQESLIFTCGYSIENDLYSDGNLEKLLSKEEKAAFDKELELFVRWYALAVSRSLAGIAGRIRTHPNHILDDENELRGKLTLAGDEVYPEDLYQMVLGNYVKYVRGKSLLPLLMRHLSYAARPVRHNHRSLLEVASVGRGSLLQSIYDRLAQFFSRLEVEEKSKSTISI
ncbi:hypothetical protein [Mesorhizobium sp. LNHC221B00]|uniref:hypothetical protein n=1 Tax=Mesorhizobium sp. LNHC221B00 TaxID=1287233 RepID=UPI0004CE24CF|nr:hypothetical protein [Mesorhizobium sp. LNHC221B00]